MACLTTGGAMSADRQAAAGLEVGDPAPDVTLALDDGTSLALADAGAPVVIYFYPKDDTAGCTKQACTYRDRTPEIKATGAIVVGVSFDDAASHNAFREKYELPFKLATDDGSLARAFGVELQDYKGAKYHSRDTIVIGADGKIRAIIRKSDPVASVDEVLDALGGPKKSS
jgi:peroxiredoxin Q/BCP